MRRAAILAVDELVAEQGVPAYEAVTVTRFFNGPLRQRSDELIAPDSETRLWLSAAAAQREALIKLWREEKIGDDVLRYLEREIDLAEARLVRDD